MAETKLVKQIKEIARDIFRTIGSGHSEEAYQKAMEVGLRLKRIKFQAQKVIELKYEDHFIGFEKLDILVGADSEQIILELKASQQDSGPPEEQQLRNYMNCLGIKHGLLINFPQPGRTKKEAQAENGKIEPEIISVNL